MSLVDLRRTYVCTMLWWPRLGGQLLENNTGTRERSRVPPDEKAAVTSALHLLFSESSDRVATQLGLLITNIARCCHNTFTFHFATSPCCNRALQKCSLSEKAL